jgi:hypothetical protein
MYMFYRGGMILYVHSRFLPLSTFVVSAKANWTVRRVRGSILHNLAEIGHQRHPFRLKFKGAYLQDGNTLYDSGIFDNVAVELIPLATHAELQSDLFWRYVPNRTPSSDPHLKALDDEINIFNKRESLLKNVKLGLMSLYPLVILTFFVDDYWYWAFVCFLYSSFWLYWCPGYSYLSGWVGKARVFEKYVQFFAALGVCSLVVLGVGVALCLLSHSVFNYVILGLCAFVQLLVLAFSLLLLKNVKVEPGIYVEHALSKFATAKGAAEALRSQDTILQRAAAFELATKAALGEKEKFEIVDEDLLDPLNVLTVSDDKYTQEHATEGVAELLTLPSIQAHYMARCNVTKLSAAAARGSSQRARIEALNALPTVSNPGQPKVHFIFTLFNN